MTPRDREALEDIRSVIERALGFPIADFEALERTDYLQDALILTWTPKTEPVLMRASQPARLGQEKPHETQAPHSRADHPQAAHC